VPRFRPARPARTWWNLAKTLGYLLPIWFLVLFVVPIAISVVEIELGIQRFPPQPFLAGLGLIVFSALGAWAAVTLAILGEGTPAPFDTARKLVIRGPYAFMRHPIVVATIGLGISIGLALGSVPVLVYFAISFLVWYLFVRRAEERDLANRFGDEWNRYAQNVRAFRPRLTPYRST
jgi:protein-S-isoprenylcysteine O-methyltransferase Ste14